MMRWKVRKSPVGAWWVHDSTCNGRLSMWCCTPHAISLGWIQPGHGTYQCAQCGDIKRGNGSRKLCGGCNWNIGKGRNR